MASKPMLQRDDDFDATIRHMMEMPDRMKAAQRVIVQTFARKVQEKVMKMAPINDPDLQNYAQDLKLHKVLGRDSYSILYRGKPEPSMTKDPKSTVLYVKEVFKSVGRWSDIFKVLGDYGPFSIDSWPMKIPKERAYVIYRTASESEVNEIKQKNKRESKELIVKIAKLGIRLNEKDFKVNIKDVGVTQDMAYTVIRKEFGLGGVKAAPHWKPAIREARSGSSVDDATNNIAVRNALGNPSYKGYEKLGKMRDTVSASNLKETEKFQNKVTGAS